MATFLERLQRAPRLLWLDADAYAAQLLSGGAVPWTDAAALVAWHRQAMALVRNDVAALRVASVAEAWIAADPGLCEQMRERRQPLMPLRQLLASEALREHLLEVLAGLRFNNAGSPLALLLPSPRAWLVQAFTAAHGEPPALDDEIVESAATYLADFLRSFAEAGIDALLLEPADDEPAATPSELEVYQPLRNVASHYGWAFGLRGSGAAAALGFDFAIAPQPQAGVPTGLLRAAGDWTSAAPADDGGAAFVYAQVPAHLRPESVLERLAGWR